MDVVAVESTIRWATERLVTSDSERDRAFAKDKELPFMTGAMEFENTVMSKINCGTSFTLAFALLKDVREMSICVTVLK